MDTEDLMFSIVVAHNAPAKYGLHSLDVCWAVLFASSSLECFCQEVILSFPLENQTQQTTGNGLYVG